MRRAVRGLLSERGGQLLTNPWKTSLLILVLLAAAPLLFWQPFRLSSPIANEVLFAAAAFICPWRAILLLFSIKRRWGKILGVALSVPLMLYSTVLFLTLVMSGLSFRDGRDLSFDRFAETEWRGSFIRLYRTNGGATTDWES